MKQYLDLLQNIIDNGVEKESGRANMPNTIGISKGDISMDLSKGFPLLTTKKMFWKGIVHELLWFLRGDTNIKYLVDNNVNIWNSDAYRWYLKKWDEKCSEIKDEVIHKFSEDEFITWVKKYDEIYETESKWPIYSHHSSEVQSILRMISILLPEYRLGDLGKVYGYQWRNQNGVDQVKEVLDGLSSNPYSRYHIIDGWNKADFKNMALPPCHLLYQFIVRPLSLKERVDYAIFSRECIDGAWNKDNHEEMCNLCDIPNFYLDLNLYQRSCDSACGIPFNLASMSLLLMLFAKANNMITGVANWIGGDTHLYINHIETAKEQLKRTPYNLPTMNIKKDLNSLNDILALTIDDFELTDYVSHPTIKYELFVGLKK